MKDYVDHKLEGKKITIDLPQKYIDLIDFHCNATLLTRRKWFFDAMMDKLHKDGLINE